MSGKEVGFVIGGIWLSFWACEKILSKMGFNYEWKNERGISTSLGGIWWQTNRFNPFFQFVAMKYRNFLTKWFSYGVFFGFFALLSSFLFLLYNLFYILKAPNSSEVPLLVPLIPGVNLPLDQLFYYFLALGISGIVHEGGHAVAGVIEKVGVESFGIFLMIVYPGAFVEFKQDFLQEEGEEDSSLYSSSVNRKKVSIFQQLKIICAGAWHNALLALFALLVLYCLPVVLFPFYSKLEGGLLVTHLSKGSAAESRIQVGEIMTHISDCPLKSLESWNECNLYLLDPKYSSKLLCISSSSFKDNRIHRMDCCNQVDWQGREQCFSFEEEFQKQNVCISARIVVEEAQFCGVEDEECQKGLTCLSPVHKPGEENEVYFRVQMEDNRKFAFKGNGASLWQTVGVGIWKSRRLSILPNGFPDFLKQWMSYLVSISGALALLNMAPAFYLDGQHACSLFLQLAFNLSNQRREIFSWWICLITTCLLALNILLSLYSLL